MSFCWREDHVVIMELLGGVLAALVLYTNIPSGSASEALSKVKNPMQSLFLPNAALPFFQYNFCCSSLSATRTTFKLIYIRKSLYKVAWKHLGFLTVLLQRTELFKPLWENYCIQSIYIYMCKHDKSYDIKTTLKLAIATLNLALYVVFDFSPHQVYLI